MIMKICGTADSVFNNNNRISSHKMVNDGGGENGTFSALFGHLE